VLRGLTMGEIGVKAVPDSLETALVALREDDVVCNAFGHRFIQIFTNVKAGEIDEFNRKVQEGLRIEEIYGEMYIKWM